ncbi:MAG: lysophospholipid acyltransferase family protein [Betaproteobacteria bacterium]|nr:lysophospholipid acyltransferase family protein [Betaproteobacteria bacterium]
MLFPILRLLARMPLKWLHAVGVALGWIVYGLSPTYAARFRENLFKSGVCADDARCRGLLRQAIGETGKGVTELICVWFGAEERVSRLVTCDTWNVVEHARREGRGIVFLTPHLGCFEISALYGAQRLPITVMYRPPKMRWLEPLMLEGRQRWHAQLAPATTRGVRALYKALRRGEAVGLLPDQAPGVGEGAWADFFGRPAYTMTLVSRLQQATGAAVVMAFAERLPGGRGYRLHLETVAAANIDEAKLNRAIEEVVRRCPAQYLWGYNRYKVPAGAGRPEMTAEGMRRK